MPEEPENWWELTPGEGKQGDPDSPEPVVIRGHQTKKETEGGDGASEGKPSEWSYYSKQNATATGIFLFTFIVGDWWWDGSNGFGALLQTVSAISDWPYRHSFVSDYHPNPILLQISWALWDITPAVFLISFLYGSSLVTSLDSGSITLVKEASLEIRQRGKRAHFRLKYFVVILILMDFITFSLDPWFPIVDYPLMFFENRPGIYWMFIALVTSYGLDPDCEWMANAMKEMANAKKDLTS
jgi:hypothetical protein